MHVRLVILLGLVGFSVLIVGCDASNERPAIARGIRAPLADFIRRDARAFCSDFTPAVAARLGSGQPCELSVKHVFMIIQNVAEHYQHSELPGGLAISDIQWRGDHANVVTTWPWPNIRRKVHLSLEKIASRWRVATPVSLTKKRQCSKIFHEIVCRYSIAVEYLVEG